MIECKDDIPWGDEPEPHVEHWFEIRNDYKPNGIVIAIWHKTNNEYELAFGIQNLSFPPELTDTKRTYGRNDLDIINRYLVHEISESEFGVLTELADIPQIISDGVLHHLGVLKWHHDERTDRARSNWNPENSVTCTGNVYAKVVISEWFRNV